MFKLRVFLLTSILLGASNTAFATCYLDGSEYETGAIIGEMICGSDGYWHPK